MKFSLQEIEQIAQLNKQGMSQSEIGEQFGVTGQYIGRILNRLGIETNRGGWLEKKSVIKIRHQRILDLFDAGKDIKTISSSVGLTQSGVTYVLKKFNRIS